MFDAVRALLEEAERAERKGERDRANMLRQRAARKLGLELAAKLARG